MFRDEEVSFILIKVKNRVEGGCKFQDSALQKLSPLHVFKRQDDSTVYDLCEVPNTCTTPAQCIVTRSRSATRSHNNEMPEFDCSLGIRGMFAPNTDADNIAETRRRWPFLSANLIKQLRVITNSEW
ncbi:hypothetical protein GQ600_12081 [Phytophthora cactorum]|nr:hypothetical protein GQ600_12081 [Phytophthora cactorum]